MRRRPLKRRWGDQRNAPWLTEAEWALDNPERTASLTLMNAFYPPAPTLRPSALIALLQLGHLDAAVLGVDLTANLAALSEEIAREPGTFERAVRLAAAAVLRAAERRRHVHPALL